MCSSFSNSNNIKTIPSHLESSASITDSMDVVTEKESYSNEINLTGEEEFLDDNKPIIFDHNNVTNIIYIF